MMMNVEDSVLARYTQGAQQRQEALCCPVDYDNGLQALLPQEIIDRDYGCGDPSHYVQEDDVVLDLGSGYMALAHWKRLQRSQRPLVASESVDLVISNCVLNLVADPSAGPQLMYRGPFASVTDDAGNHWQRGVRITVSPGTARLLLQPAYQGAFIDLSGSQTSCRTPDENATSGCC